MKINKVQWLQKYEALSYGYCALHFSSMRSIIYLWRFMLMPCKVLKLCYGQTRGPTGSLVPHLRKRSKVTMEQIIGNPRNIIWTTSRGPFDYVICMKDLGLVVSDNKIFESFILKPIYWPHDLLMQPTETLWTTLIGDHPGIILVKFGQILISGLREDVVWSFSYIIQCKIVTTGAGSILTPGA